MLLVFLALCILSVFVYCVVGTELWPSLEDDVVVESLVGGLFIKQIATRVNCHVIKDECEAPGNMENEWDISFLVIKLDVGATQS